jgi:hypothetical protein
MVALFFLYYNFCRVHSTLRVTPAMEADVTGHVWSIDELCALLPETPLPAKQIEKVMTLKALRNGALCLLAGAVAEVFIFVRNQRR